MQENNSLNATIILRKIKAALNINTDLQLSEFLNVKPNTISTWKKRNSLDYAALISICDLYEIDLNEIFKQSSAASVNDAATETALISREVQFQYCMGVTEIESLPKFNFPFVRSKDSRAFQVLSNNMFPMIEENSFVICEAATVDSIPDNSLVVIVSKAKGLFINQFSRSGKRDSFALTSRNDFFNTIYIERDEINEIWLIKGKLTYNINIDSPTLSESKKAIG